MRLDLKEANAVVELGGERLFLVVAGHGALERADGIAVVCANVGDVRVETAAERGVAVADTGALGEGRSVSALGRRRLCDVAVEARVDGLTLGQSLTRLELSRGRVGKGPGRMDGERKSQSGAEKLGDSEHGEKREGLGNEEDACVLLVFGSKEK